MYFTFRTSTGKVKITCDLDYARWLVNTWRVVGGVWTGPGNRIYL
jgi:hypothetical protein